MALGRATRNGMKIKYLPSCDVGFAWCYEPVPE
jgi:hypothetical protein